jgi:multidrug efflux system membrane fusion protein
MVTINQISPVYVTFAVPEKELLTIKRQMAGGTLRVEAAIPSDPHGPNSGTVTFIDNTVDMATGTIKLKGTFANAERRLWPGQFVNVTLTLAVLAKATVVPSQAVQTGQQGQYVFVVLADGTAELRPVTAGISHGGVMVIEKGLAPGETVVTDGQMRLMPGAKVEVKQPGQGGGTKVPAAASGAGGPTGASPATGGAAPPAQPTSGAGLHGSKP